MLRVRSLIPVVCAAWTCCAFAQSGTAKPTLKVADYAQWQLLGEHRISGDGRWFAFVLNLVDGDGSLIIRNSDTEQKWQHQVSSRPRFTDDSKFAVFTIGTTKAELKALEQRKKRPENKAAITDLTKGETRIFESVARWDVLKDSNIVVMLKYPAEGARASDLVVYNLEKGTTNVFGNVASYVASPDGKSVALLIRSSYNGIQLLNPVAGSVRTLRWNDADYPALTWSKDSKKVGFLQSFKEQKKDGDSHQVVIADPIMGDTVLDPRTSESFPKGMRVIAESGVRLSDDGAKASFGVREWEDQKAPRKPDEEVANVDVWHSIDVEVQPIQQRLNEARKRQSLRCVWTPEGNKFVQLSSNLKETVVLFPNFEGAMVEDPVPYETPIAKGGLSYSDFYVADVASGRRTKVLEKYPYGVYPSETGAYLTYFLKGNWYVVNCSNGTTTSVTAGTRTKFENDEYDGPMKDIPPADYPEWLHEDKGAIFYDNFNAYLFRPERTGLERLTNGEGRLQFRLVDISASDEESPKLGDDLYFVVFDRLTKDSGLYYKPSRGEPRMLVLEKANIAGFQKSANTDRMTFVMQTFEKSPNVLLTNTAFSQAKPLTNTNPQQEKFAWGKAELVNYKGAGWNLQGSLYYPANYQPGRKYPMVTYIYERLTQGFNRYMVPREDQAYDVQYFIQNGYFVLMPDIAYKTNRPGQSAQECLEAAVKEVLRKNVGVDASKVGLMGHSWGAYQTTFVLCTSKVFAAGVAGAPLTELTSMYNSFYWNSGTSNQVIFESSQGRFDAPWWENLEAYTANSPIWQIKNLTAPLMIAFGDKDGAVDWHQGLYLYNTMRRMGKSLIMLVYPGENHGLANAANKKDYAVRLRHFFDVHLKSARPEKWMLEGVPFAKKPQPSATP